MISEGSTAGLEAWVEGKNDHKPLNEFQVNHYSAEGDKSSYTECFLETIDEPFKILIKRGIRDERDYDYSVITSIDGVECPRKVMLKIDNSMTISGILEEDNGRFHLGSLKFFPLPTTDDSDQVTIDSDMMKNIGTIEIVILRGSAEPGTTRIPDVFTLKTGTVHEKSKKFAYSVATTNKISYVPQESLHYRFSPEKAGTAFHRFIFRYRPRAVLIKMGIIDEPEHERPPTPPPANRKRKRQETTVDDESLNDIEEVDVKPLNSKRMKYLEDQVKMLTSRLKRSSNGDKGKREVVDLTLIDDDTD